MQPYPLWKTLTLVIVTLLGTLYALPNLYGQAPAVQVTTTSGDPLPADFAATVEAALTAAALKSETSHAQDGQWHHPQLEGALREAPVQQGLQQCGNQRLGDRADEGGNNGKAPGHSLVAKVDRQSAQACGQACSGRGGSVGRRGARICGLHVARILRLWAVKVPVRYFCAAGCGLQEIGANRFGGRTFCHRGFPAVCNIRVCLSAFVRPPLDANDHRSNPNTPIPCGLAASLAPPHAGCADLDPRTTRPRAISR